jgi:gamma-glutamyl-gamma-aminobutyrate hydrolase PuuD
MKNILLTQRIIRKKNSLRDANEKDLINFLMKLNCFSYPIPNSYIKNKKKLNLWLSRIDFNGLVLSGGNDLGEYSERDKLEKYLIGYFIKKSLPVLGICRGSQILAKYFGNKIFKIKGHVGSHNLDLSEEILVNKNVNSFHRYGIKKLNKDFKILARCSNDKTIEAFRHKTKKIIGIMWHPERFKKRRKDQEKLIEDFFI